MSGTALHPSARYEQLMNGSVVNDDVTWILRSVSKDKADTDVCAYVLQYNVHNECIFMNVRDTFFANCSCMI